MDQRQILFYDGSGQPVYAPVSTSRTAVANPGGGITIPPVGNYCADNNSYIVPPSFTMTADNSAGLADVVFKHTSFDNVVEAIRNEIGGATSLFFSVDELPNGNGTIPQEDATNIFGDDCIRRFTATYAIAIKEIVATGDAVADVTELIVNVYKGSLTTVTDSQIKLVLDESNASSTPVLRFTGLWYLTSNKAFSVLVPTGTKLKLRFGVAGFKPYTELF